MRLLSSTSFLLATASFVPAIAASQAAMFRGGPAHLGVYASTPPTLQTVVWKFRTEGRVISSPLVVGGTVYVGSTDGGLYALDRATGAKRWKFATEGAVNSSPALSDGIVVVSSVDGGIYGVSADSGTRRWRFATRGERRFTAPGIHGAAPKTERMPDPFDLFLSSPTIVNGVVYIGSGDQQVYALDLKTGALKWSFATGDVVHASPAVVDGVVYVGSWDRNFYALDAATGREKWRYVTGNDTVDYNQIGLASSAAVTNGMVFVGGRDGKFHAVDARTGAGKWTIDNHGGWTIASPAVQGGVVFFATSDGRRLKGIDAVTGAVRFDVENKAISFSSPAIAGEVVFYGSSDGFLNAARITDGVLLGRFQTDGSKENGPRLLDEQGHIRSRLLYPEWTLDGMIIGIRAMMTLGSVLSSPAIVDGVAYFGSTDGQVYAVR